MKLVQLIIDNKEWIFSGIGIAILSVVVGLFFSRNEGKIEQSTSFFSNNQGETIIINKSPGAGISNQPAPVVADKSSIVEVVDVRQLSNGKIDFLLKNTGNDTAFIKRVIFKFRPVMINKVLWPPVNAVFAPTYEYSYGVSIEYDKKVVSQQISFYEIPENPIEEIDFVHAKVRNADPLFVSQHIKPNDIDRFQVNLALTLHGEELFPSKREENQENGIHLYVSMRCIAIIEYDKDQKVETPEFNISFGELRVKE